MYNAFFGFRERPFQLVPNPAYLFLSKCHEEALAHLIYAVSHGDGFVEIIGEVGTGKTTLCRVFLEHLDDSTEAAYIFNPKLNAVQLLKAINDEFAIDSGPDTIKELIDVLNGFLLQRRKEGKNVVLLIDEAQNLTQEVLEQLRLLSNLETNTQKLLQIILVGQPELDDMLHSYKLRQLGQRITLSCHLRSLSFKETREYIQHRIHIASARSDLKFTSAAFREIYKYSGGLPRLINIACDRALLTAFGYNQLKIAGAIARGAVRELQGKGNEWHNQLVDRGKWIVPLSVILVVMLLVILFRPGIIDRLPGQWAGHPDAPTLQQVSDAPQVPMIQEAPEQSHTIDKMDSDSGALPAEEENVSQAAEVVAAFLSQSHEAVVSLPNNLKELLQDIESAPSRIAAAKAALELWGVEVDIEKFQDVPDEQTFFQLVCKQNDLLVRRFEGNLGLLENIDLPAVLRLELSEGLEPKYLTLCKIRGGMVTLCGVGENFGLEVEAVELLKYWPGVAFVPWKNFMNIYGIIPEDTDEDSIRALKAFLREIGFAGIDDTPYYDERTRQAIISIQEKYRIHVDGVVGASTKIVLYNEKKSLPIPRILEND
jgi:general secretion pathway protein A